MANFESTVGSSVIFCYGEKFDFFAIAAATWLRFACNPGSGSTRIYKHIEFNLKTAMKDPTLFGHHADAAGRH